MRYSSQVTISPLSSVYFGNVQRGSEKDQYPNAFSYVQKVSATDSLHIQLHADTDMSPYVYLQINTNEFMAPFRVGGAGEGFKTWTQLSANNWYADWIIPATDLVGVLYIQVIHGTDGVIADSWPFEVGVWDDTVLVSVAHKNNDLPNTVFPDISANSRFGMRIEGGFVPDGDSDESTWEAIQDQSMVRSFVDAQYSMKETIAFGDANGIPRWVREWLRLAFCCSDIDISNLTIVRAGDWSEETTPKRMKRCQIEVNVYDTLDGEIALTTEGETLLNNELEQTLIL